MMKDTLNVIDLKIASLERQLAALKAMRDEALRPRFTTIEELRAYLDKHPPKPKPKSQRKLSLEEIDGELDIIRGVKPTPAGYVIDARRMKELMKMRQEASA